MSRIGAAVIVMDAIRNECCTDEDMHRGSTHTADVDGTLAQMRYVGKDGEKVNRKITSSVKITCQAQAFHIRDKSRWNEKQDKRLNGGSATIERMQIIELTS